MKGKFIATVLALLAFAPLATSAASVSNIKFDSNGQVQVSCTAGQTVNATFRVVIPAGEVAEIGQTDVVGDNLAPSLPFDLGGELGLQEGSNDVSASFTCPQNTGYYTAELRTAGIFGGQRAVAITDGVTSVGSFGSAIRVVSTNGSTTSGSDVAAFAAIIAKLTANVNCISAHGTWSDTGAGTCTPAVAIPTPTPVAGACTEYAQISAGLYKGSDTRSPYGGGAVGRLQGFLLGKGAHISLLETNKAPYGFYGDQTDGAVTWFKGAFGCN